MGVHWQELISNLVRKALYCGAKAIVDYRVIDDSTTVAKIVGFDKALVVCRSQEIYEIRPVRRSSARVRRVAQRVDSVRLLATEREICTCVRVTTGKLVNEESSMSPYASYKEKRYATFSHPVQKLLTRL